MYDYQRIIGRSVVLAVLLVLGATSLPSCSMMEPGNIGFFCETHEDCKPEYSCQNYGYDDGDDQINLCTGDKYLEDSSSNYGWAAIVAVWLFVVVFPALLLLKVIFSKAKGSRREPTS